MDHSMASNPKKDPEEGAGSSVRGVHWNGREENLQPEQECRGVRVSLENHRMWREFSRCHTEMVASNQGSRMFPYCRFSVAGLHPSRNYCLRLDLRLNHKNRFIWTGTTWEASEPAHTHAKVRGRPFTHPDSPAPGRHWMESPVSFYRLKLTDGASQTQQDGAVPLTPNHRYLPTLLVLPADGETDKALTFSFPQTEFMAVSSYQNKALSQLKVHYNPFSKGPAPLTSNSHRGRGHHTDSERGGGKAQCHPVKSLKSLLANHRERKCRAPPSHVPSSSPCPKLFSELIREAHVSLHRCNVDHLGRIISTSKPPTSLTTKEQAVVPSDRMPTEALPLKAQNPEVKHGSPESSSKAPPKQNKRPPRLPLPALALFLKQHAPKSNRRKEAPPTDTTQHMPHPSDATQHRPHPSDSTQNRPHPSDSTQNRPHPSDSTQHRPHPSDSTQHRPHPSGSTQHRPHPSDSTQHRPHPSDSTQHRPHPSDSTQHRPHPSDSTQHRPHPSDSTQHRPHPSDSTQQRPHPSDSTQQRPHPSDSTQQRPHPSDSTQQRPHPSDSTQQRPHPSDSTQQRPHPSDSTQHRPHPPGPGPDPETCLASGDPEPSVCDVLRGHASSPVAPATSFPLRPQPSSKPSDWAALLNDPECSSLGFEPLSPSSSPEPLPSLPASLTFDLDDSVGPQGDESHASSVFQWHTVLPPQNQGAGAPPTLNYADPQSPHRAPPGSPPLSPLVLSLSPSFSSLNGDGLSPTSSLADLVQMLSNTDEFSTTDLTNDQSAGSDLTIRNLSVDSFPIGCHGNDNKDMNDVKGLHHNHDDDDCMNPTCTEEVGPRPHRVDNHSVSTDPLVCVLTDEHISVQPSTNKSLVSEDLTETNPPTREESPYRTMTSPPPREDIPYRSMMSPRPKEESTYGTMTSLPPTEESPYRTMTNLSPTEESPYRTMTSPPPSEDSPYRTMTSPPPSEVSPYRTMMSPPPREEFPYMTMSPPPREESPYMTMTIPSPPPMEEYTRRTTTSPPSPPREESNRRTTTSPPPLPREESTHRTTTSPHPPPREESTNRTATSPHPPPREESTNRTATSSHPPPREKSTNRTATSPHPPPREESTNRTATSPHPPPREESTNRTATSPHPPPREESTNRTATSPHPPPREESTNRTATSPHPPPREESTNRTATSPHPPPREESTNRTATSPHPPPREESTNRTMTSLSHPPREESPNRIMTCLSHPPREESPNRIMQPSLEEVEEQLFVSFTTKEALKLHTCDSSVEAEPHRAVRRLEHEDTQQNIAVSQDLLLGDLQLMKYRQVIHPVLQEVGLKMNLLDSQSAVDLQYLGVRLPIPPPGTGREPASQAPPSSAPFVSKAGKASAVTQIKGWKERFSPSEEAPPPAAECSLQGPALAEPQKKKNLSAFCSDMLDEYLENEGKLLEQKEMSSFSQTEEHPPLYSCSYAPTPSPASQIISAFVPPSKRPRVPEVKRRGRKPRQPKVEVSPPPTAHKRRRRKRFEAPPLEEPPSNELAPLESDSELGPLSETEGRGDDLSPPKSPPPSSYLAPLESDSELAPPLPKAPPPRPRVLLKQRDLENAALWDGHARTAITEGRANIALSSLFTLKGFVCEDPLAPVQMECKRPPPCLNDFCRLGCVCDSLSGMRRPAHCARPDCMFSCSCLKQKMVVLRNVDSPSPQDPTRKRRRRRKRRRMKMGYILKEVDHVSEPSPLLRTLWTNRSAADPEPVHDPRLIVPPVAEVPLTDHTLQEVQSVPSSCARVRAFTGKEGETATAQQQADSTTPVKNIQPSDETPSGSSPKPLPSRRLLVHADCEWKNDFERSEVLQQLCEALTLPDTKHTFWIKDFLIRVSPSSLENNKQNRVHISRPQGLPSKKPGRPRKPGPGVQRESHSSVRPSDQRTEVLTQQQEAEPGEMEKCSSSTLPLLSGVSPAGFLSANRREVGGTKQLIAVNGKLYPRAKIELGMMGALHPANRLAALLTGRVASMRSTPSPQQAPPTATVDHNDDTIIVDDEAGVSMETEPVDLTNDSETDSDVEEKNQHHNLLERQRRQELSQHFDFLRREIGLKDSKSSKILILNKASQEIKQLEEKQEELMSRKNHLQRRRDRTLSLISSKERAEPKASSPEVTADTKDKNGANQLSRGGGAIVPRALSPPVSTPPTYSPLQAMQEIKHRVEEEEELLSSKNNARRMDQRLSLISSKERAEPKASSPEVTADTKVGGGGAIVPRASSPISAPPTSSPVHLLFKTQRTMPNILLHNKQLNKNNVDGGSASQVHLLLPQQKLLTIHKLLPGQLVLQSHTNPGSNKVTLSVPKSTNQPLHLVSLSHPHTATNSTNVIKVQYPPVTQPPQTDTKLLKVYISPQTQQPQINVIQQAELYGEEPLQALPAHQLLLQTQPLQLIAPAVSCDLPPAINGWTTTTNKNLQKKPLELISPAVSCDLSPASNGWTITTYENVKPLLSEQAMPISEATPTETLVGVAKQGTAEVELNQLIENHLETKGLPPLMQMNVGGAKLLDTTGTVGTEIGAGVEGGALRPMPRLLKGNPPTCL